MSTDDATRQTTVGGIFGRALKVKGGEIPPEVARYILELRVCDEDQRRVRELLARRREGRIDEEEASELASHIQADNILAILRAEASLALRKARDESMREAIQLGLDDADCGRLVPCNQDTLSEIADEARRELTEEQRQEQELQRRLFDAGLLSEIKPPRQTQAAAEDFEPIEIEGEPLSEMIIRERR